ncbi:hypothetical protein ACHQM5_025189 [Ranunculus cassubicifolius]
MVEVGRMKLGSQGLEVSSQGLGCMGMSAFYGPPKPEADLITLIRHSIENGITFLDTSDFYGPFTNEILIGKALKGIRHKVQLATKFAICYTGGKPTIRGDPAHVRAACEASLKRLDVDYIDLYYQHRVDVTVPIEVIVRTGISRRAHDVHPITAVQLEWSLWTRDVEDEIIPTCRELGIGIVAYSPLGRGFLSLGPKILDNLNLEANKRIFETVNDMAKRKGCTPSQLALAWVHHQGDDVCPIPGTTKIGNFNQNVGALSVNLEQEEMAELARLALEDGGVKGDRYGGMSLTWKNSDTPELATWKSG